VETLLRIPIIIGQRPSRTTYTTWH